MTQFTGDNRLPMLADEARRAHSESLHHAEKAADRAIAAGATLVEAKALCGHGEWGKWLAQTGIPERSAQRYMKLHRAGLKSATVADLGGVAEAERFLAWHHAEGLQKWPAQDVAEDLIEGRRIRDLTSAQLCGEINAHWAAAQEGWLAYGTALNEARALLPSDEQFEQCIEAHGLSQFGIFETKRDDRAAAMWAAANPEKFEPEHFEQAVVALLSQFETEAAQ